MIVHAIPTLADLGAHPERVDELAPEQARTLLAQATTVAAMIATRLSSEPQRAESPAPSASDRLLTAKEAAVVLNLSTDFLYKSEAAKPFRVRFGNEVRFSLAGIQRFIERHRGR